MTCEVEMGSLCLPPSACCRPVENTSDGSTATVAGHRRRFREFQGTHGVTTHNSRLLLQINVCLLQFHLQTRHLLRLEGVGLGGAIVENKRFSQQTVIRADRLTVWVLGEISGLVFFPYRSQLSLIFPSTVKKNNSHRLGNRRSSCNSSQHGRGLY